jgi:RNA ligase (TIGR02306 family)
VGHRIKTVRLKGVYSQGVIMPISEFPELGGVLDAERDYSEDLGIVKWEAPEFTGKAGKFGDAKGNFPWFLRKTDQERIQNLYGKLIETHQDVDFVGTLKMDGSSIQVGYVGNERFGEPRVFICSRNLELKYDPEADTETQGCFIKGAVYSDLFNKAKELYDITGVSYSIQGELVGNGIQGNFEKFEDYQVFAYNIFNIDAQEYVSFYEFESLCDLVGIQTVPVVYCNQPVLRNSLQDILILSNIQGLKAEYAEGIVWKSVHGTTSFKVISNFYLEKQK